MAFYSNFEQRIVEGIVTKSTGSWYTVKTGSGSLIESRIRGKFRIQGIKTTNPIAVGDQVTLEIDEKDGSGVITEIHPRKNYIIRRSTNLSKQYHILAANIDQVFLVVTISQPRTSNGFIDRFLVTAESFGIDVLILINKKDLYKEKDLEKAEDWIVIYSVAGYKVKLVSTFDEKDIADLRKRMEGKKTLFCGHSGSGKSSMINALEPSLKLKTGDISSFHQKGMHTTTFAEMFPFGDTGAIIDTPGIKELGLVEIGKAELSHYFPEMRELLNQCRFDNCIHVNEPGCKVKDAVEEGLISQMRYESYLNMIESNEG